MIKVSKSKKIKAVVFGKQEGEEETKKRSLML